MGQRQTGGCVEKPSTPFLICSLLFFHSPTHLFRLSLDRQFPGRAPVSGLTRLFTLLSHLLFSHPAPDKAHGSVQLHGPLILLRAHYENISAMLHLGVGRPGEKRGLQANAHLDGLHAKRPFHAKTRNENNGDTHLPDEPQFFALPRCPGHRPSQR
jgi:hypothetical protein